VYLNPRQRLSTARLFSFGLAIFLVFISSVPRRSIDGAFVIKSHEVVAQLLNSEYSLSSPTPWPVPPLRIGLASNHSLVLWDPVANALAKK
jgi:hypothetical protein